MLNDSTILPPVTLEETIEEIKRSGDKLLLRVALKASENELLEKKEIVKVLLIEEPERLRLLFKLADAIRRKYTGETVLIKGIIEFSNYCKKNCLYCGIRAANRKVERYRMKPEEIVETAERMAGLGINTIILQSGEDPYYTADLMEDIIREVRRRARTPVSISIGNRTKEEYTRFKEAGASKCLLKHETINREIFEAMHPDDDYDERISILKHTVEIGYIAGSGNIVGLPGQTIEDIAEDIIFLRDVGVKMVGLGPFVPASGTPLENHPPGDPDLTLKIYALVRLSIPRVFMPATTALGTLNREKQFQGFFAGCNVIMCNFTPEEYRKRYNIYNNKIPVEFYDTARRLRDQGWKLNPLVLKALEEHERREKEREMVS